ncbi:MAG: universal stress protein [Actinomycetota bacterium]
MPPPGKYADATEYQDFENRRVEQAWQLVKREQARLRRAGFDSKGTVLLGSPGPQLLKEAENLQADLVVAGARGIGPIRRAFLGSVTDQLARHAPATLVGRRSLSLRK